MSKSSSKSSRSYYKGIASPTKEDRRILGEFVREYEAYFTSPDVPLELEPEMLHMYTKRNNLTHEETQFLLERPHYIYASQAMAILDGTFRLDDYYYIRNKDYYRRPLIEFLPAELHRMGLLEKRMEFDALQMAKLERNINAVSVLDVHGDIMPGFLQLPADLTLCFITQPFNVGFGNLYGLLYDLQNKNNASRIMKSPVCFGKQSENITYKNMNVYYPGQMVPNMLFTPESGSSEELQQSMGYYSGRDISKMPVSLSPDGQFTLLPNEKIGMGKSPENTVKTALSYKTITLDSLLKGTSFVGKISGVVIITSCRDNPKLSSFHHESISRYETFINIFNYVIDQCKMSGPDTEHYHSVSNSKYDLHRYYKVTKPHIPFFDYRLLSDFVFYRLTSGTFDMDTLQLSLMRRANKIRDIIDKYNGEHRLTMYKAEQMVDAMQDIPIMCGSRVVGSSRLKNQIYAQLDIGNDEKALKLVTDFMDNDCIKQGSGYEPDLSWLDEYEQGFLKTKDMLKTYYSLYLEPMAILAFQTECPATFTYIISHSSILFKTMIVDFIASKFKTYKSRFTARHYTMILAIIQVCLKKQTAKNTMRYITSIIHLIPIKNLPIIVKKITNVNAMVSKTISKFDYSLRVPVYVVFIERLLDLPPKYAEGTDVHGIINKTLDNMARYGAMDLTIPITYNDMKLNIIDYLFKTAMEYNTTSADSLETILKKLVSFSPIQYPIHSETTLATLKTAFEAKNADIVRLIMKYIYPDEANGNMLAFNLAAQHDDWFRLLITHLPYPIPDTINSIRGQLTEKTNAWLDTRLAPYSNVAYSSNTDYAADINNNETVKRHMKQLFKRTHRSHRKSKYTKKQSYAQNLINNQKGVY